VSSPQLPERPYALQLDAAGLGSLLGATAWVLGALEIMRDRGHAEADEELHELQQSITPRLERLLSDIAQARTAVEGGADSPFTAEVEQAYTRVREAFERWIQLTASDTVSVAIGQRLADLADEGDEETAREGE
jgi:hypothetical protein